MRGFDGIRAANAMEADMGDESAVAGRRARGGGGSARRAERTAVSFETARFIERHAIPIACPAEAQALDVVNAVPIRP